MHDGDTYGEGMGHFIASCRGNHDITLLVHDNQTYGLTTGQAAPTTQHGRITKSTPTGLIEIPVNPVALAVSAGATWVGRGFAGNIPFTTDLIKKAINHKGFSVLDVLQPCVTFNKVNTHLWYNERVQPIDTELHNDRAKAWAMSQETEKLPIGLFYEDTTALAYHEQIPVLKEKTLVSQSIEKVSIKSTLLRYM
jgi:2-oxoglutarate ferredoxin oxidoreductase subunit beta